MIWLITSTWSLEMTVWIFSKKCENSNSYLNSFARYSNVRNAVSDWLRVFRPGFIPGLEWKTKNYLKLHLGLFSRKSNDKSFEIFQNTLFWGPCNPNIGKNSFSKKVGLRHMNDYGQATCTISKKIKTPFSRNVCY